MGYGVIGSTPDSGSVSLGSSPGTPAVRPWWLRLSSTELAPVHADRGGYEIRCHHLAPLCSGLARRPLKAVARVRIPSGLRTKAPGPGTGARRTCTMTSVPRRPRSSSRRSRGTTRIPSKCDLAPGPAARPGSPSLSALPEPSRIAPRSTEPASATHDATGSARTRMAMVVVNCLKRRPSAGRAQAP